VAATGFSAPLQLLDHEAPHGGPGDGATAKAGARLPEPPAPLAQAPLAQAPPRSLQPATPAAVPVESARDEATEADATEAFAAASLPVEDSSRYSYTGLHLRSRLGSSLGL